MTLPITEYDIDTLARTVYGEARGESLEGRIAVAWVVRNRAQRGGWYGTSISEVCLKRRQFSCWNADDINAKQLQAVTMNDRAFQECYFVALGVLLDAWPDYSGGADHYLNLAAVAKRPDWFDEGKVTVRLGRHTFLRLS